MKKINHINFVILNLLIKGKQRVRGNINEKEWNMDADRKKWHGDIYTPLSIGLLIGLFGNI